MMEIMVIIYLVGVFIFCFILYNLIKSAVSEGTLEALLKYESLKSKGNKEE